MLVRSSLTRTNSISRKSTILPKGLSSKTHTILLRALTIMQLMIMECVVGPVYKSVVIWTILYSPYIEDFLEPKKERRPRSMAVTQYEFVGTWFFRRY